jgi:hypothetical protein
MCSESIIEHSDSGKHSYCKLRVLNFCRPFFDNCDGIFLNYTWKEDNLKKSVENAGTRHLDVYVGVDVFGRNCYGGGGFNSCQVKLDTCAPNLIHIKVTGK